MTEPEPDDDNEVIESLYNLFEHFDLLPEEAIRVMTIVIDQIEQVEVENALREKQSIELAHEQSRQVRWMKR